MKFQIKLALFAILIFAFSSCLTRDLSDYSDDAEMVTFYLYSDTTRYLYSDTIAEISEYTFTVDDDELLVYNSDSIDYGTRIDSLLPIIAPTFLKIYINDTIEYVISDSVYLDFTQPMTFTVYASDLKTYQTYTVNVNIHQVDPDSCVWADRNTTVFSGSSTSENVFYLNEQFSYFATVDGVLYNYISYDASEWEQNQVTDLPTSAASNLKHIIASDSIFYYYDNHKLYSSVDGINWSFTATAGDVDYLLFDLNSELYGVDEINGKFVQLVNFEWIALGDVPYAFPVDGAAVFVGGSEYDGVSRGFVVGGIDESGNYLSSVWSTENGSYWSNLSLGKDYFTPRAYAAGVAYADGLMLFGGYDANGVVTTETHLFSDDYGVTWTTAENKMIVSSAYAPRFDHSVVYDSDLGYLYLFGGRTSVGATKADIWRGYQYKQLTDFED
ncbi:MAG: DUF6242 domain-containing protein [bacterium]